MLKLFHLIFWGRILFHSNIGNWLKGKYPLFNKGFIGTASFDEDENKF